MKVSWLLSIMWISFASDAAEGQCRRRNQLAAAAAGRPCRKPCFPGNNRCKNGRVCLCDGECGYSCVNLENNCPAPPAIPNLARFQIFRRLENDTVVQVTSLPYKYGDWAEYACRPGYTRDWPIMQHHCHSRAGWTGRTSCILSCKRYNRRRVAENGMICGTACKTDTDCRDTHNCLCDGYCGQTCVDTNVDCGPALPSPNSTIRYNGEGFHRVAQYSCDEGFYVVSGSSSRKCTGGGTWDGDLVSCQRVICGDPWLSISTTGGRVLARPPRPYHFRQVLNFACPTSYRLIGSESRTCLANGRWTGQLAICDVVDTEVRCKHPGIPVNGRLVSGRSLTIGSFVEYECDPGFLLVGERRQECLYFLQWSGGGAPKCINPHYPENNDLGLYRLQESSDNIQVSLQKITSAGHSVASFEARSNAATFFVIDLADDVRDDVLNRSLSFAEDRAVNISRGGSLRCAVIVFASDVLLMLKFGTHPLQEVAETLRNILSDRENIIHDIGLHRNTDAALKSLNQSFALSFADVDQYEKIVFLLVNGRHTTGESPKDTLDEIKRIYKENTPEIYVISYGDSSFSAAASAELRYLAFPKENFYQNPDIAKLSGYVDPVQRECGKAGDVDNVKKEASVGFVLGGANAAIGAWPWQAVICLYHQIILQTFVGLRGGGCLINNQWVLTAAHLFDDIYKTRGWEQAYFIAFGLTRLPQSSREPFPSYARAYVAERIITHSLFRTGAYDHDIALVKLGSPLVQYGYNWQPQPGIGWVTFTNYIRPACLPCSSSCANDHLSSEGLLNGGEDERRRCNIEGNWLLQKDNRTEKNILTTVTGFGAYEKLSAFARATHSKFLKQGLIRLLSDERCRHGREAMLRDGLPKNVTFSERMLCGVAGSSTNVDACKGDSGGALVRELKNDKTGESCWVAIGIVSWGWGCGQSYSHNGIDLPFPGFYTNILPFIGWIKSKITGGHCPREPFLVESGRSCRKYCTSDRDCRGRQKSCNCDDVCGMSCFNRAATCEDISQLENGLIRRDGNGTYGSTITSTCEEGYVLKGSRTRKCRSDRKWSGTQPHCRALKCLVPEPPLLGSYSPNFEIVDIKQSITLTCDEGYEVAGVGENRLVITCLTNQTWSYAEPRCIHLECVAPDPPEFGSVSPSRQRFRQGDVITFRCGIGFRMADHPDGILRSTCLSDKTWSVRTPRCVAVECVVPVPPRFGIVSTDRGTVETGERITYQCNPRYRMFGNPAGTLAAQCRRDGTWSAEVPVCVVIDCVVPQPHRFGSVSPNEERVLLDETVTYRCNNGYRMVGYPAGRLTVTCQEDRSWSEPVPNCIEITCLVPNPPQFGRVSRTGDVSVGEVIVYSCGNLYRMVDVPVGQLRVTCQLDGTWSRELPQCLAITCDVPAPPQFGTVSRRGQVPINQQVTFRCNRGYNMVGQPTGLLSVTCLRDESWSDETPVCEVGGPISCPISHALISVAPPNTTEVIAGGTVTYTCSQGFRFIDRPGNQLVATCQADGTWNLPVPRCRGLGCTTDRNRCAFPFNYRGHYYSSCTTRGHSRSLPWCSKTPTVAGSWGNCAECEIIPNIEVFDPSVPARPHYDCYGELIATSMVKLFTSPNFPLNYQNNMNCYWTIRASRPNGQVEVELKSLSSERCCDYIRIHDGSQVESPNIAVARGKISQRFKAISTFGVLYVAFRTDSSITYQGFQFSYREFVYTDCGSELRATTNSQTLSTPGWPGNYPDNTYCKWIIRAPPGMHVRFDVANTLVEFCCDSLTFLDGLTETAALFFNGGGNQTVREPLITRGRGMIVRFRSDESVNHKGFTGTYQAVSRGPQRAAYTPPVTNPGCGATRSVSRSSLETFNLNSIPATGLLPYDCFWIFSAPAGHRVRVWFSFTQFRNIWTVIRDGNSASSSKLGAFSGVINEFYNYVSSGRYLRVELHASNVKRQENFYAFYEVHIPGGDERTSSCGGRFTATNSLQFISTPNWPDFYSPSSRCTWILNSGSYRYVTLHVYGILTYPKLDKIEIFEGNLRKSLLSANGRINNRFSVFSRGRELSILFTSDPNSKGEYGGFRAAFVGSNQYYRYNIQFN